MRIGIDVESGERSFQELIKGSLRSVQYFPDIFIYLIGNSTKIKKAFPEIISISNLSLVQANEIIYMDEKPISALKKKKGSTVAVGIDMLKSNIIDVFFSAGNTGATVVASVLKLGMIHGIKKPSMATFFPRIGGGETLILDIGANPDADEEDLYYNAILGQAYYKLIWDKYNPSVGLLNMGAESGKGSIVIKKAFNYLNKIPAFIGNVEGYDLFNSSVDVVVCDGFIGNSILKSAEAMKKYFIFILKKVFSDNISKNKSKKIMSYVFNLLGFYTKKKKMIIEKIMPKYYGAAPLLGVNGIVMIGHGTCSALELINAIELSRPITIQPVA